MVLRNKEHGVVPVREMSDALVFSQSAQHPRILAFMCHWNPDAFNGNARHVRGHSEEWLAFLPIPLENCSPLPCISVHHKSPGHTVPWEAIQPSLRMLKVFAP